jgi:hypothetical protein
MIKYYINVHCVNIYQTNSYLIHVKYFTELAANVYFGSVNLGFLFTCRILTKICVGVVPYIGTKTQQFSISYNQ